MTQTAALTRHFFENAAGRAWLDDEGVAGLRSVFFSALAGLGTIGLFLPRRFSKLYVELSAMPTAEPYHQALLADTLFMLTLPAIVTAWIAIVLAPAMFPDETDYVTLASLPLTRRQIFGAKALALAILIITLIGAMILLFGLAFPAFSHGRWADTSRGARVGAHIAAAAASSLFAALAIAAVQGTMLLALPRRWLRTVSTAVQSGLIALLVLSLPFVFRFMIARDWVASEPPAFAWLPPAWFLGLERVILGTATPFQRDLAAIGSIATAAAAAGAALAYLLLYRRVEHLLAPPDRDRVAAADSGARVWRSDGVWTFITATLSRSRQSQMLFLVAWATGGAIALNNLMGPDAATWLSTGRAPRGLLPIAVTLPLPMMVMGLIGVRAAFLLPVNTRANWIFRVLDLPSERAAHLGAADRGFFRLGLLPALLLCFPLQVATLGAARGTAALLLNLVAGLLLAEIIMAGWRRVPFTCTWLPGKRPLPLLVVGALIALIALLFLAAIMIAAAGDAGAFVVVFGLLALLAVAIRWRRRRSWAAMPLQFEDEPIDRVQQLGLHQP